MEAAAYLNLASEQYLEQLDTDMMALVRGGGSSTTRSDCLAFAKYLKKFQRSCRKLTCKAGDLYTLEKTIMLVSMHNCAQLVFNLLLTYPKAEEGE